MQSKLQGVRNMFVPFSENDLSSRKSQSMIVKKEVERFMGTEGKISFYKFTIFSLVSYGHSCS